MVNKKLLERAKKFLEYHKPQENLDRVFLVDDNVIKKLIEVAKVGNNDRVLEIGAGLGFITKELAKKAKKVIAIEIDKRFKPYLFNFPRNIDFIFDNIHNLLKNKEFLKRTKPPKIIISNIPYRQVQAILISFMKTNWYKGNFIFIAPSSLVDKINQEVKLKNYFKAELIERIDNSSFYPIPNTIPSLVYIKRVNYGKN